LRVLVAEDDQRTASYLVRGLTESGHIVDHIADGEAALAMAMEGIYDALVLDRKLPGIDGVALVRRFRLRDRRTPVLMLSGVATTADRVEGLRAGCDDYLAKPYSFSELLARLEALGRRTDRSRRHAILKVSDLELDTESRTVTRAGRAIDLQRREYLLLAAAAPRAASGNALDAARSGVDIRFRRARQRCRHAHPPPPAKGR